MLHGAVGDEAVDVAGLDLAEAINAVDALHVLRRVPGHVEDDDAVGGHQVDAEAPRTRGDQEEARASFALAVEHLAPLGALLAGSGPVQSEVVQAQRPRTGVAPALRQQLRVSFLRGFVHPRQEELDQIQREQALRKHQDLVPDQLGLLQDLEEQADLCAVFDVLQLVVLAVLGPPFAS